MIFRRRAGKYTDLVVKIQSAVCSLAKIFLHSVVPFAVSPKLVYGPVSLDVVEFEAGTLYIARQTVHKSQTR